MYIKQVIIEGFRSYREQTVIEPFSSSHNVIVGRNGCGKSNFFKAIQFVLSDEYTNLKEEDRIALLHEGSGPKVMNAFVEIIFDNSDGRLPIEKEEVAIKRAIGLKKDQYFLDKKVVTKADIMNFLETAGFSRNNPYYIVKQGKINEISISKDSFRLKILKEVAGSNVYDEKREESKSILKETEDKRQNIIEVLKAIEERLTQLEVEKEELKEFQKWDKMKRSIEYTIHNKELEHTQLKLNELSKNRMDSATKNTKLYEELNGVAEQITTVNKEIKDLKMKEQLVKEGYEQVNGERSEYLSRKARLELDLKDAIDENKNAEYMSKNADVELQQLNRQIVECEESLKRITPEYDAVRDEEERLQSERDLCEQERDELYAKQGRNTRFRTKEERDQWLRKELDDIQKACKDKLALKGKLDGEVKEDNGRLTQLRTDLEALTRRSTEFYNQINEESLENFNINRRKDELVTQRNDLWRRENALTQEIAQIRDEYQKIEQNLRSTIGRTILQGIESINQILKQFEKDNTNKDVRDGYYGLLIDNIDCLPAHYTAIETSLSSRLFYHIVKTDDIALKLLKQMNQQKLHGEVNYLPLNVLKVDANVNYPKKPECKPLISLVKYEKHVESAIKHVFEKILLCCNSDIATLFAKQYQMDCVIPDGDFVSRKGALTGGYVDHRQSKLSFHRQKTKLQADLSEKEAELEGLQNEIRQVDAQLNAVLNELQKHENILKRNKDTYEQMKVDTRNKKLEIERIERSIPQKDRSIHSLLNDIQQLNSKNDLLNSELGTELVKQLSANEQKKVDELNDKVHRLNQSLKQVLDKRARIEREKYQFESNLTNNLNKRKEQLEVDISENRISENVNRIKMFENELRLLDERILAYEHKLSKFNEQLSELHKSEAAKLKDLDKLNEDERRKQDDLHNETMDLERVAAKLSLMIKKKEDCLKATRNLGVLPQDAYDKYLNFSTKELYVRLEECNLELKKLSHVNKKAMDQYVQFGEHKEKLIQRREEIDRAYESIIDFMNTLDQRKNENMQLTFKQVSKYFSEIFTKLVPQGSGHLVMRRHDNFEEEDRQSSTQDTADETMTPVAHTPHVDEYTGVGIRVSFVGKTNEMKDIQQLSGGQKTLVALGLIFAIQRCDPAPFYLFDEIDQALDPQYRTSVANMIHELSEKAQFITTTFRPELLEHADKFYGVRFRNKISIIDCVSKDEAFDFVEDDQSHK